MLTIIVSMWRCLEAIAEKYVKCAREEEKNYYPGENRIAHKWTLWLRLLCVIRCRWRWLISPDCEVICCGCRIKIGAPPMISYFVLKLSKSDISEFVKPRARKRRLSNHLIFFSGLL
jgi:hypothetical protein